MAALPVRKDLRLKGFDYSENNGFFVTICAREKAKLFGRVVEGGFHAAPHVALSEIGLVVEGAITYIGQHYGGVTLLAHCIMPNHIHMLIGLTDNENNMSLPTIIGQFKSYTTRRWGEMVGQRGAVLWQRNYYEHVIRNRDDLMEIWQYIEQNPAKWIDDRFYC